LIRRFHEAKEGGLEKVTCWGTGSPMREFLHVDDLGNACVFALENWSALDQEAPRDDQGKPLAFLNVGTGVDLTIKELAEQIAAVVGFEGTIEWDTSKPDGTPKKQLEVSRMQELGWKANILLKDGLKSSYLDFCKTTLTSTVRQ
jgi:GDP-L-fucose synthase